MGVLTYQFDLISHLVQRDFRLRYTGTLLGLLWSVALPWTWFSSSLGSAGGLFSSNRDLVRRPNFTPATLVLVNTLSQLLSYLVSIPILLVVLAVYDRPLT